MHCYKEATLKVCSADPLESLETFRGGCEVKTIFIIIPKCYLPLSLC